MAITLKRKGDAAAEPALLTAEQAAAYLGVSLTVLKDLTRDGWVPVVVLRRGSRRDLRRWSRAFLERVIEQREEGGRMAQLVATAVGGRPATTKPR
jgi:hypothetical protein